MGAEDAAIRERSSLYLNLLEDEGVLIKRWWHELNPDEDYPEY